MNGQSVYGMIFAAGIGSRLAPITQTIPKALVPVNGIPVIEYAIKRYIEAGITNIVINVHHFADKIEEYLKKNNFFNINILVSDERRLLLDTGGGLAAAHKYLKNAETIVVSNADILTDFNIKDLLNAHIQDNNNVTMLVSDRKSSRLLYFDNNSRRLCGWANIKTGQTLPEGFKIEDENKFHHAAFGGIHVLDKHTLDNLSCYKKQEVFSIIPYYVEHCHDLLIREYTSPNPYLWHDIGTIDKLKTAEKEWQDKY